MRSESTPAEVPVVRSLLDTSRSTIKLLVELWYALWHEAHH